MGSHVQGVGLYFDIVYGQLSGVQLSISPHLQHLMISIVSLILQTSCSKPLDCNQLLVRDYLFLNV